MIESPSGKAVPGARVDYWAKDPEFPRDIVYPPHALAGADGTFRMVLPPGPGHLLANAPTADYGPQEIAVEKLDARLEPKSKDAPPFLGPQPYRPHGWVALDLKPGDQSKEVTIRLRRLRAK